MLSSRALVLLLTRLWCVALLEQKFVASGFVSYFSCDNKGCYIYDPIGLQLASGNYIGTIPFLIPQPQKTVGCSLSLTVVSFFMIAGVCLVFAGPVPDLVLGRGPGPLSL